MGRDRSYTLGAYRVRYYPFETAGGVSISEHYAVEIMTNEGWKRVAVHPDGESAALDRDQRRRRAEGRANA